MTTQILELPPVIQDILNDLNHPLHDYFVVFQSRFDCFIKTSDFNLRSQAQSVLEGMFVAATCLPSFSVELCCELKLFSDAVLDYHHMLEKAKLTAQLKNEQMTELAPSLDDSVIAVHQEATCPKCGLSLFSDNLLPIEASKLGCLCTPSSLSRTVFTCYKCGCSTFYLFGDSCCAGCTSLTPDAEYEDTALGCTCALGD